MMLIPPTPVDASSAAVTERPVAAEVCYINQKMDGEVPLPVEFDQRYFAFGEYFLALERNPKLLVNARNRSFEIVGWNIRLPDYQAGAGEIGREIIRKFLSLLNKAEQQQLSTDEAAEWAEIVKNVDYRKFSIENSPPVYVEGKLRRNSVEGYEVEWHDGKVEVVHGAAGEASLALLNPGEWFKAYGKFGEGNRLVALSQVVPISAPDVAKGEELWESMGTNRS